MRENYTTHNIRHQGDPNKYTTWVFFFHWQSWWFPLLCVSRWIHILSPVTIRCEKLFRLCLVSSITHVQSQRSTFFVFSSYGIQFSGFWIIHIDFKPCKTSCWATFNVSGSSSSIWHESSSNNVPTSKGLSCRVLWIRQVKQKLPLIHSVHNYT